MLVLIRRVGESITIGEEVTVTVLGVRGAQVRVGIGAPRRIAVHRLEFYERLRASKYRPAALNAKAADRP
jgi:carbon storage regulator